jgi:hypothetical protein
MVSKLTSWPQNPLGFDVKYRDETEKGSGKYKVVQIWPGRFVCKQFVPVIFEPPCTTGNLSQTKLIFARNSFCKQWWSTFVIFLYLLPCCLRGVQFEWSRAFRCRYFLRTPSLNIFAGSLVTGWSNTDSWIWNELRPSKRPSCLRTRTQELVAIEIVAQNPLGSREPNNPALFFMRFVKRETGSRLLFYMPRTDQKAPPKTYWPLILTVRCVSICYFPRGSFLLVLGHLTV